MSNFVGLNTALSGIRASQLALDTVSHNVANANTEGFTRQRVDQRASLMYASPVGPLGTGTTITGISRLRDGFLDARVRTGAANAAFADTRAQLLSRTESVMAEPDNGISTALGDLWAALDDLTLDPSGGAERRQVVSALEALTGRVRSIATGWDQLARDTEGQQTALVSETNSLLERVGELNRTIPIQTAIGGPPNDLMDERDKLVDRLAELVGATASAAEDGTVTVSLGGVALVSGTEAANLAVDGGSFAVMVGDPPAPMTDGGGDEVRIEAGGKVGAITEFLTVELPAQRARLDEFVEGLVTALDDQHAAGFDSYGDPGGPLFTFDATPGQMAGSLRVDPAVAADPGRLAAAGAPGTKFDAANAVVLAGLRDVPGANGLTADQTFASVVVDLAGKVASSGKDAKAADDLANAATVARYGMHGVSLDEEMADLVRYQRSLEAMSRVMTSVDEALNVLINRTGIVGR